MLLLNKLEALLDLIDEIDNVDEIRNFLAEQAPDILDALREVNNG